jgi:hypothetical protein
MSDDPKNMARVALRSEFQEVWNEFLRIWRSIGHISRNFVKGVGFKEVYWNSLGKWETNLGEIYNTGETLSAAFNHNSSKDPSKMVSQCLVALTIFVKYLKLDKKPLPGFDEAWRDIYHYRNLKFKEQWTLVLRHMIDFVPLLDPEFEKHFRGAVHWPDVLAKVRAAEVEVAAEKKAAAQKTAAAQRAAITPGTKWYKHRVPAKLTSELTEPHALERMRELLGEI